jgi:hypothetical protein
MECSGVIGCSTDPILTVTVDPETAMTGTCFSFAASVVFGTSSDICSPQHSIFAPDA